MEIWDGKNKLLANIGIEASFWNKYRIELTYYNKKTSNMLMDVPVPYTSGFSSIYSKTWVR